MKRIKSIIIITLLLILTSCYKYGENGYETKVDEEKQEHFSKKYKKGGVLDKSWSN